MEQNIDKLFKDSLGNLEADVNPKVWTNIEQGLKTPLNGAQGSGGASASKSAGMLGKLGLKNLFFYSGFTAIVATTAYFVTKQNSTEKNAIETQQAVPMATSPVTIEKPLKVEENQVDAKRSAERKPLVTTSSEVKESPVSKEANSVQNPAKATPSQVPESVSNISSNSQSSATDNTGQVDNSSKKNTPPAILIPANGKVSSHETQPESSVQNDKVETTPPFAQIEKYLVTDENNKKGLPNSFSPNGDGQNDVFTLHTINLKILEVTIFDQKGKKIYSWKSISGGWDGKFADGTDAPAGNYYYALYAETSDSEICIAQSNLYLVR